MVDQTEDSSEHPSLKKNLRAGDTWIRGFYLILFLIIAGIVEALIVAIMLFQFLSTLFVRKTNDPLVKFARSLSAYVYEIALYITYGGSERPFPFKDWPTDADRPKRK